MADVTDIEKLEAAVQEAKGKVEAADDAIEEAEEAVQKAKEAAKEINDGKGDEADDRDFVYKMFSKIIEDIEMHKERLQRTGKQDDSLSAVTEIIKGIIQDVTEGVTEAVAEGVAEGVAQGVAEGVTEDETEDVTEDVTEGVTEEKKKKKKIKIDLNILAKLQKAEDRAKELTAEVDLIQYEIEGMEDNNDTSDEGKIALTKKRTDLQMALKDLEDVTKLVSDLLDKLTIEVEDDTSEALSEIEEEQVDEGANVCVCKPAICICKETEPYIPGLWLEQQVDPFPGPPKEPGPPCVCKEGVCICGKEEDEECVCRKEDIERFSHIEDLMPKVVVCAPDTHLPRIIVCEPYTPKKLKKTLICT